MIFITPFFILAFVILFSILSSTAVSAVAIPSSVVSLSPRTTLQSELLSTHNAVRANHGASPLTWSYSLAEKAEEWADGCNFAHSDGTLLSTPYGENIAAGTGNFPSSALVDLFVQDASQYNALDPTYNHFTQVVWKSTTQLGCAVAKCGGIFDSKYGDATYYVCLYNPAGNVVGEALDNVQV